MEVEPTLFQKQKIYQDRWRKKNQQQINEYYRKKRLEKKELELEEYKNKIILDYLSNQLQVQKK